MSRFILVKGILVQRIRGSFIFFRSIAVGHHLPDPRWEQIVFLRIHVHSCKLDAPIRQVGVISQILYDVLNVPGRVRVSVLGQLRIPLTFEGGRLRRLQLPVKRSRSTLLWTFILARGWVFMPVYNIYMCVCVYLNTCSSRYEVINLNNNCFFTLDKEFVIWTKWNWNLFSNLSETRMRTCKGNRI